MINFLLTIIFGFCGTIAILVQPNLLGAICGGIMWFCAGGFSTWELIGRYRQSLGFKKDPFEPENIYMM